jgi:hypothetical protein
VQQVNRTFEMRPLCGFVPALLLLCATACGNPHGGERQEYAAQLAAEADRLVLHAADHEPGKLRVWLTTNDIAFGACPRFDLAGKVNGQPLRTVDKGGLKRVSTAVLRREELVCTLPVYELLYDIAEALPNSMMLELGDDTLTFHAVVSGPSEVPRAQLAQAQTSPGAVVSCDLSPKASVSGLSAVLEDAAGERQSLEVVENSGSRARVRIPLQFAPGKATLELRSPNWIATQIERCEGPESCLLPLQESLNGYAARSSVRVALDVR